MSSSDCSGRFAHEAVQCIELIRDAAGVRLDGRLLKLSSHFFDGRKSVAASGAFQIVPETPYRAEVARSQGGARFFNLFRFGGEILRNQRDYFFWDRDGGRVRADGLQKCLPVYRFSDMGHAPGPMPT